MTRTALTMATTILSCLGLAGCGSDRADVSAEATCETLAEVHAASPPPDDDTAWPVTKSDAEWRAQLTAEQYYVARQRGTEARFTGEYWDTKTPGVYLCIGCDQPLYASDAKYDSGTGWPSFWQAVDSGAIATRIEQTIYGPATELLCSRCGSHLGHVFNDGPPPTGKRHCINSASLKLVPADAPPKP